VSKDKTQIVYVGRSIQSPQWADRFVGAGLSKNNAQKQNIPIKNRPPYEPIIAHHHRIFPVSKISKLHKFHRSILMMISIDLNVH
jgi:hypothetical protein